MADEPTTGAVYPRLVAIEKTLADILERLDRIAPKPTRLTWNETPLIGRNTTISGPKNEVA